MKVMMDKKKMLEFSIRHILQAKEEEWGIVYIPCRIKTEDIANQIQAMTDDDAIRLCNDFTTEMLLKYFPMMDTIRDYYVAKMKDGDLTVQEAFDKICSLNLAEREKLHKSNTKYWGEITRQYLYDELKWRELALNREIPHITDAYEQTYYKLLHVHSISIAIACIYEFQEIMDKYYSIEKIRQAYFEDYIHELIGGNNDTKESC